MVKAKLNSILTNDLKKKIFFSANVNYCRLSLFKNEVDILHMYLYVQFE